MEVKTIPISRFRSSLDTLSREVISGKAELVVTRFNKPFFKVIRLAQNLQGEKCPFMQARDQTPSFLDLLDIHSSVILTSYGKPRVACIKL